MEVRATALRSTHNVAMSVVSRHLSSNSRIPYRRVRYSIQCHRIGLMKPKKTKTLHTVQIVPTTE